MSFMDTVKDLFTASNEGAEALLKQPLPEEPAPTPAEPVNKDYEVFTSKPAEPPTQTERDLDTALSRISPVALRFSELEDAQEKERSNSGWAWVGNTFFRGPAETALITAGRLGNEIATGLIHSADVLSESVTGYSIASDDYKASFFPEHSSLQSVENAADFMTGLVWSPNKVVGDIATPVIKAADYIAEKFGYDLAPDDLDVGEYLTPEKRSQWEHYGRLFGAFTVGNRLFGAAITKGLPGFKWAQAGNKAGWTEKLRSLAAEQGIKGIGNDLLFNDDIDRFSDLLCTNRIFRDTIGRYLTHDDDDTYWDTRLKNAADGILATGALSLVGSLVKVGLKPIKGLMYGRLNKDMPQVISSTEELMKTLTDSLEETPSGSAAAVSGKVSPKQARRLVQAGLQSQGETIVEPVLATLDRTSKGINPNTVGRATRDFVIDHNDDIADVASSFKTVHEPEAVDRAISALSMMDAVDPLTDVERMARNAIGMNKTTQNLQQTMALLVNERLIPKLDKATREFMEDDIVSARNLQNAYAETVAALGRLRDVRSGFGQNLALIKAGRLHGIPTDEVKNLISSKKPTTVTDIIKAIQDSHMSVKDIHDRALGIKAMIDAGYDSHLIWKQVMNSAPPSTQKQWWGKALDTAAFLRTATKTIWMNNVLSGVKTTMVNTVGNVGHNLVVAPAESFVKGVVRSVIQKNGLSQALSDGALHTSLYYRAMKDNFANAIKSAGLTFRVGRNVIDGGGLTGSAARNTMMDMLDKAGNFANKDLATLNKTAATANVVSSWALRSLNAQDALFKHLVYSADIAEKAVPQIKEFLSKNKGLSPELRDRGIKQLLDNAYKAGFGDVALATGEVARGLRALDKDSLSNAMVGLFQGNPGPITKKFSALINAVPGGWLVAPFVNVPTNLLKYALVERNPFVAGAQFFKALTLKEQEKIIEASGRLFSGTLLWGLGYMAYQNGIFTGAGPDNPTARQARLEAGIQPYSIKIGDTWHSLARFEPFATPAMLLADVFDLVSRVDDTHDLGEVLSATFDSLVHFAGSRTYWQGVTNLLGGYGTASQKGARFMSNALASFTPNILKEMRESFDPRIKEVRTLMEKVKNRLPELASDVPDKYSWLTGKPMIYQHGGGLGAFWPYYSNKEEDYDPVFTVLSKKEGGTGSPSIKEVGLEMTSEQLSEFNRIHGSLSIRGKTMYQALRNLFESSPEWSTALDMNDTRPITVQQQDDIDTIIKQYRKAARAEFLKLHPEVDEQVKLSRRKTETTPSQQLQTVYPNLMQIGG